MSELRKIWLKAADNTLRVISAREQDLARLKAGNGSASIIKRIDTEIDHLITFYNETEQAFKTFEQEALNLNIRLLLAKKEVEELRSMLMELEPEPGKEKEFLERLMKSHKKI